MPNYRFYTLNKEGHVDTLPVDCECSDDDAAVKQATRIAKGKSIEIWQGERKVGLLKSPDVKVA